MTITEAIDNCYAAANDAIANGGDENDAFAAALPDPTSRRTALSLIACAAAGVSTGHLPVERARLLLYAAQLALSTLPKRASSQRRKPRTA